MHASANSAGGWRYHARAWARGRREWAPYLEWVAAKLGAWRHGRRSALVFGPSAGYSLPNAWWESFERVACVEPDPLARRLLRLRAPRAVRLEFLDGADALARLANQADASALRALLGREAGSAVLFANVLGQLPFLAGVRGDPDPRWGARLLQELEGRPWASFHDAISARAARAPASAQNEVCFDPTDGWRGLAEREWPVEARPAELTVRDHGTAALSRGSATPARWWPLAKGEWHLVAWTQAEGQAT